MNCGRWDEWETSIIKSYTSSSKRRPFLKKNGKLSESARRDLHFYLIHGRGKLIPGTGGLKSIRWDIGARGKKEIREAVFAAYNCPHIRTRIYYLLVKYPAEHVENLTRTQKAALRTLKDKVDEYIRRNYGE